MSIDKRAAREAWKQRQDEWTVFAARTGGRTWVGVSADLSAMENRLAFTLKTGSCRAKGMQSAWDGTLSLEALEKLDPDLGPLARAEAIRERRTHWAAILDAAEITA
ncbi:hypothetical protein GCM10011360_13430 [Primorskyibacter flagellatus]|uniref:GIY-YIG nuclease family protein n=1 Tax=Primorskyibacter flagellatus TaxID=1387277 RepID=A0A917A5J4_9RHOB|nr:GIY-YIG nuclease family protein [Primorskyibacter flagellatus]GGE26367.1 hypothetical protein GCM10011360_13430 [Primorskyibacter flagellatus]